MRPGFAETGLIVRRGSCAAIGADLDRPPSSRRADAATEEVTSQALQERQRPDRRGEDSDGFWPRVGSVSG